MAALKAVVIIMGMLILTGIAVIAFTIVNRSGDGAGEGTVETIVESIGVESVGGPVEGFGALRLDGAAGCRIVESGADGGRLIVRTEGAGANCGRVHILDIETGKTLGTIEAGAN